MTISLAECVILRSGWGHVDFIIARRKALQERNWYVEMNSVKNLQKPIGESQNVGF